MTTFQDIFKRSFLEGYAATGLTGKGVLASLLITCGFALYIFFVYRSYTRKSFYSKSFNISLTALTVITAAVILTIQSSIVVSLGMVGALSIVRFRTAIKDPMDLVFLFWSISIGIICGAGLSGIAFLESVIVTVGIFLLELLPVAKAPMLLIVNATEYGTEKQVIELVKQYSSAYKVKSRTLEPERVDFIVEVRIRNEEEFMEKMSKVEDVRRCSLVSHDGEVTF